MEAKLAQQLVFLERMLIFGISLDLHEVYAAMNRSNFIDTPWDNWVGEKVLQLIK